MRSIKTDLPGPRVGFFPGIVRPSQHPTDSHNWRIEGDYPHRCGRHKAMISLLVFKHALLSRRVLVGTHPAIPLDPQHLHFHLPVKMLSCPGAHARRYCTCEIPLKKDSKVSSAQR